MTQPESGIFKDLIRQPRQLPERFQAAGLPELDYAAEQLELPFAVSRQLLDQARPQMEDPIVRQFFPSRLEEVQREEELADPLGEARHRAGPPAGLLSRLVHQYPSRALIRVNGECAAYCRFCYRRSILGQGRGFISLAEQEAVCAHLAGTTGISEVLLSGGDPLFASTARLDGLLQRLRQALPKAVLRLCTRLPLVLPERVNQALVDSLVAAGPLVVVLHCNHPAELSTGGIDALRRLRLAGLPLLAQTVLLRGVNATADILADLCTQLLRHGVQPYYLFQGDLTRGTAHFRVPLSYGLEVYRELRRRLSGLALPRYAVDAPGGNGKMYLPEDIQGRGPDGSWLLRNPYGRSASYPEEGW